MSGGAASAVTVHTRLIPIEERSMQRLTVWRLDTPSGADDAVKTLQSLTQQELIKVHDAAVVSWDVGKKKPKTRQLQNLAGSGALGGAFAGQNIELLFTNMSDEQENALRGAFAE
jgi:uncharacterized membrane protein